MNCSAAAASAMADPPSSPVRPPWGWANGHLGARIHPNTLDSIAQRTVGWPGGRECAYFPCYGQPPMVGHRLHNPPKTIGQREVHVYEFDLACEEDELERLTVLLDDNEQTQAGRFATDALRRKYVISHGNARLILGHYLDVRASEIRFVRGEHGKPRLDSAHQTSLQFNLSHSGDKCLVAATASRAVGIDVERVRSLCDWKEIAQRFFSRNESARLSTLSPALVVSAFFATWSRKEAYIKALGLGLALDLGAFEVEVDPRQPARLLWALDESEGPKQWVMKDVVTDSGYYAALAVRDLDCLVHQYALGRDTTLAAPTPATSR